jgi:hypothetical protein
VNNTITAVAFTANTGVFTGNGSGLTALTARNISTGTVSTDRLSGNYSIDITGNAAFATTATSANTAGTVTTNAQGNITSVGTLVGLTVSGAINAGNVTATLLTGTLTTAAQPNITSVGTLTSLAVTGNASAGNISTGGVLSVTGNANVGNLGTATAIITTGNITTINSGLLQNGNSNVTLTANANVSVFVAGNATARAVFTSTGANIAGTANITGNANVGNLGTAGLVIATGNVSGGNLTTGGVVAATGNVTGGNLVTGGALAVTGNANVGNLGTARVLATANVTAPQLISNVAIGTAPLVVTSTTRVANLNVATAGAADSATNAAAVLNNVRSTGTYYPTFISATANGNYALNSSTAFSANLTTGTVFATDFNGNLIVSNINSGTSVGLTGLTTTHFGNSTATSGNITFQRFRGNNTAFFEVLNGDQIGLINFVAWDGYNINPAASITSIVDAAYTPGITTSAPGAIVFNTANATQGGVPTEKMRVTSTGNVGIANTNPAHTLSITGTLNASGNANVGNLGTARVLATANVTAPQLISNVATGTAPFIVTSTTQVANLSVATAGSATSATTAGTVTTNAQPNITSTGTLTSLTVSGNITAQANVNMTGYVIRSVGTGIIALGLTQLTAVALTKEINVVTTVVPLLNTGVRLPVAVPGMVITITNTSANTLSVWPHSGGDINGAATNAAFAHSAGATLQYVTPNTTDWYTVGATFA